MMSPSVLIVIGFHMIILTITHMCFKYPFDVFKCGKCPECLQEKRREWSIRLQLHTFYSGQRPFYCHLTYDNSHVPINEYGNLTLKKEDVQKFIKRLRTKVETPLKYYIAGEYGPNGTHRPHYHCIIFGIDENLEEDKATALVQQAWQNGEVRKTSCWLKDYSQLHYATKYIINFFDEDFQKKFPPFRLCSSGFGQPFIDFALRNDLYDLKTQLKFRCKCHQNQYNNRLTPIYWYNEKPIVFDYNEQNYVVNPLLDNFRDFIEWQEIRNGIPKIRRYPLPRYFIDKLYTHDFRIALAEVKMYKMKNSHADYLDMYRDYDSENSKTPMWKQLKNYEWQKRKKNKKDKMLRTDKSKILND